MDREHCRRANGEGSIYQRASDNRWVGSAYVYTTTGQRKRRPVYGASFDEVREKLDKLTGADVRRLISLPTEIPGMET
jgi:formylglycine-generating enzyme required for sulfatase activity